MSRQRFINCILNNMPLVRKYNRHYLYAVLEGRIADEVISQAYFKWQNEKGFGCKQVIEFIRSKVGDERKMGGEAKAWGSKNPALRHRVSQMSEKRKKELGLI